MKGLKRRRWEEIKEKEIRGHYLALGHLGRGTGKESKNHYLRRRKEKKRTVTSGERETRRR